MNRNLMKSTLLLLVLLVGLSAAAAEDQEAVAVSATVDMTFGTEVDREARALTGTASEFPADTGRIFCLTRLQGLEVPTTVTHAWYHEGKPMARVELKVGSADWRTWSSKALLPAWTGSWEVKVLDESGKVLAASGFSVN